MKTNLIEITVSGRTGCGKSEVLEVINNALKTYYGHQANVTGNTCKGAIGESAHTGQTARGGNTVFVLYEQNVCGPIKVHD